MGRKAKKEQQKSFRCCCLYRIPTHLDI